jgi:transposase
MRFVQERIPRPGAPAGRGTSRLRRAALRILFFAKLKTLLRTAAERTLDATWRRKTVTFGAGLRQDGLTAPFVIDRPMNAAIFIVYLQKCLVPTLRPGAIVNMDKLPAHKVEQVRQIIEAAGAALRYLPAYSPDLNPIEQAFAKLKSDLRKAKERTVPGLYDRIGTALDPFTPTECRNYFTHSCSNLIGFRSRLCRASWAGINHWLREIAAMASPPKS